MREVGLQRKDSWRTYARRIYDHEFFYCFAGHAHFQIEDREYILSEGDIAIVTPNTPHIFWVDEEMAGELYFFHCDFEWWNDGNALYDYYNTPESYAKLFSHELMETARIRPQFRLQNGWSLPEKLSFAGNHEVDRIFRSLYQYYICKDAHFPLLSKALVLQLLDQIIYAANPKTGTSETRVSDMIHSYIQSNYYRKLSVEDICKCTHLNADYAAKLFKQETGFSLIHYLNRFRINKAKKLLLEPDLSIVDIAEMVGFKSENYFCTLSKKVTGMTPAKLRTYMLSLQDSDAAEERDIDSLTMC